jgi:protein MpaA
VVLPKTINQTNTDTFKTTLKPTLSIADTPLISSTTCIEITHIPNTQTEDKIALKSPLPIQKTISLTTESMPLLTPYDDLSKPLSLDAVLLYSLNVQDKTFSYVLEINNLKTDCVLNANILGCPLKNHRLTQGNDYKYTLHRVLDTSSSVVFSKNISTLDPVSITSSSISENQLIYDVPRSFSLNSNKSVKSVNYVSLIESESQKSYTMISEINDKNITLSLSEDLPRNTSFILSVLNIESTDGAFLSEPYSVAFKTSAGPQVQGVNIGSYNVDPYSSISLTFDIELDPNQPIAKHLSIVSNGSEVPSNISIQNNTITINPISSLGICTSFMIAVSDSLTSKFGVSGNSAWSIQSRTTCQQSFSIGNSVQGRSIIGYRFGNGSTKILLVGGMHGNEKSSVYTLNSFIDDLEHNYASIPADKTVVIIPNTNPDGFVVSSRTNANSVDLNRNFPTFDWTSGVYMPGNVFLEFGGGTSPLSEPESVALASYTRSLSPRVTLTFHATGRAVFANDAADSKPIADVYARESGFTSFNNADSDTFFSYPTTGEYEDWLRDGLNLPGLLVELARSSGNEFNTQKPALWAMLSL